MTRVHLDGYVEGDDELYISSFKLNHSTQNVYVTIFGLNILGRIMWSLLDWMLSLCLQRLKKKKLR